MKRLLWLLGPVPFLALAVMTMGLAAGVAAALFDALHPSIAIAASWLRYPLTGLLLALCYFTYGVSILLIAPAINFILGGRLSPYRGSAVTLAALRWYVHCTMTLVVRYSFLEFVTPSLLSQMYYRLMGMRIGREVTLNSTAIADPSLIELGDRATIGGSANILAHYAQGGFLVIAPVKIGAGATIGMRAIIMGGVEVGEKAKVLANSFVLPHTKIPAGESWAGIPAQRIELPKRPHQEGREVDR